MKIAFHVITMNRNSLLRKQLSMVSKYVDVIRVCVGNKNEETRTICNKYNAQYYYRQWDDNFAAQDNILFNQAKDGEWILVMDSDEFPSKVLLEKLKQLAGNGERKGYNCVRMPCILILDGVPDYTPVDTMRLTKEGNTQLFRKDWLFKYEKGIYSTGSPHRGFHHPTGWIYHNTGYPYYHIKTTDDFIFNDCIHAFINPEGQGYTPEEAEEFLSCWCIQRLRLSTEVLPMLKLGRKNWSHYISDMQQYPGVTEDFQDFMWKYKDEDKPISRWFWFYYFIYHKNELPKDFDFDNDISYQNYLKHKRGYKPFEIIL